MKKKDFGGAERRSAGRGQGEIFLSAAIRGGAYLSLFLILGILGYVFCKGSGKLSPDFFLSVASSLKGTAGIGGNLVNTLYLVLLALAFSVPAGVGAAVYLCEYAPEGRLVRLIEFSMETLAGIPSVIFGLFGMVFFGDVMGLGYCLLNGALTLALMVLPLIVRNTQEALRAVPDSYRLGALSLGAGRWYMIRTVLLPSAGRGILTGITLAAGRITGESAALLFTAGSAGLLPRTGGSPGETLAALGNKIFQSGGSLAVELYLQVQKGELDLAFSVSCVLILLTLLINMVLKLLAGGSGAEA